MKHEHTHISAERMQALLDGDLPDREARALRAEVDACPRCRAELDGWEALLLKLDDLPVLAPSAGFKERILQDLPARQRPAVLGGLLGRRDARTHASPGELQEHLDGRLAARSAARLEEHLGRCAACRREMDALHQVATRVADLPLLEPSQGFQEGVMAGFRVRQMAAAAMAPTTRRERAAAWVRARMPSSNKGWAAALGAGTAPVVTLALALQAAFSHELVTFGNLFSFLVLKLGGLTGPVRQALEGLATQHAWLGSTLEVAARITSSAPLFAGITVAVLGTCLAASWVLYRNLVLPSGEEGSYATLSH